MHAIRIGRVAGIEVRVDLSALGILVLISWSLSEGLLPEVAPGYSTTEYWTAGVITAVCFLISLLAHELSHSVVARGRGVAVRDITLWLLGGVATITDMPKTPRDEFAIARAGPVMSVAVGGLAIGLASLLDLVGAPPLATGALGWLGAINIVLAVFNVIPAAPLDGGRLLKAWLWQRTGDRTRAAISATRAGEVFARILIGFGIFELWMGLGVGGIWSVLLGLFVLTAARSERMQVELEQELSGMRVCDLMTHDPITAPESMTVAEMIDDLVLRQHCSAFPVVDHDGDVVGLATLARARTVPAGDRAHTAAREIAWSLAELTIAEPDEAVMSVLRRATGGDGRILVFESGRLVGIISPSDIARLMQATNATSQSRRNAA
ncbi:MAG: site-2 protease family protein [Actinomycetota bacterium]